MTPGPAEEAGKVATGIIDALKAQPAVLALALMQIGLLLFIFYALHAGAVFRQQLVQHVFENTKAIHEILVQRAVACPQAP